MILLTGTSDLVQLITGSALAVHVHASWVDHAASTNTPGRTNTIISTATTTTLVGSPASSTQRNLKTLTVRNADATSSNVVTVQHTDGTTLVTLHKVTLLAGEMLEYSENSGFLVVDSSGGSKVTPAAGRLVKTTTLVAGSSITTGPATNAVRVRLVGGGGGGGGCSSVAAAASAGGGGGAGGYAEKLFTTTPNTALAYAIGAAGTANSGAAGGNGGDTTFTAGGVTVTAKGGTGGPLATALTTVSAYAGGAGGVVGTNGDTNASGQAGQYGVTTLVATPIVASGKGGSGPFGGGGLGLVAVGAGNAGTGNGSGGGGAATGASAARAGGAGTVGLVVVDEYS